jgi:hypothetical protein
MVIALRMASIVLASTDRAMQAALALPPASTANSARAETVVVAVEHGGHGRHLFRDQIRDLTTSAFSDILDAIRSTQAAHQAPPSACLAC